MKKPVNIGNRLNDILDSKKMDKIYNNFNQKIWDKIYKPLYTTLREKIDIPFQKAIK